MLRTGLVVLLVVGLCAAATVPLARPIPGGKPWRPRMDGRIVGGSSVSISEYPWQLYFTIYEYMCGASIISDTWALSAAHCLGDYYMYQMRIHSGTSTRLSGGTVHYITTAYIHADYVYHDYDIAVVQVSNAFTFGTNVQPVALATSEPADGTSVTVTGWGKTANNGHVSDTLQAVTLQIVNRSTCNQTYHTITDRMICAGVDGGGKDSCDGDGGGPLVSGSTQVGIVSFRNECGLDGSPGVYTNVANLRSWITRASGV